MEIEVKNWFVKKNQLGSIFLDVTEILRETEKAYQISGNAKIRPSSICCKCGRELTDPVSIELGIGPICAGIDQRNLMSQEEKDEYVSKFSSENPVKMWVPKSVIVNLREFASSIVSRSEEAIQKDAKSEPEYEVNAIIWKDRICIKSLYQYANVCKSIPNGIWNSKGKFWHYPVDESTAFTIVKAFEYVSNKRIAEEINLLAQTVIDAQELKSNDILDDIPDTKLTPWLHQKRAFWFSHSLPGSMLALDMGTGKTKVAIDLMVNEGDKKTLIICPKQVINVWPKEYKIHSNHEVPFLLLDKGTTDAKTVLAENAYELHDRVVIVVNYESAWRNSLGEWILSKKWDRIILDESHKIKQFDGKAAKLCHKLEDVAKKRNCLTGTPMTHSPLDVWSQYRFLDSSIFGKSFYKFRNTFGVMGGYMNKQVVGYKNLDLLYSKFYSIAYRVSSEDVQDLPELLHIPRYFNLSDEALRLYEEAEDDLEVSVGDAKINTSIVLTKLLRCQQITSGYLPTETGAVKVDNGKTELLEELLDDIGNHPVVVFCRFQHDLDEIKKAAESIGKKYGEISGRSKDGLDDTARLREGIEVCGVNIQAGGVGIDLTRSHHAIYYSVGYSLGDYLQSVKRIHRPGQDEKVKIWHLICEGSVDEKVYGALTSKRKVIDSILER